MNAVFTDSSAGHQNTVTGIDLFFPGITAAQFSGHDRARTGKDQRLTAITIVKNYGTVDRGNAGLVATVFNAFDHAAHDASRMELSRQ